MHEALKAAEEAEGRGHLRRGRRPRTLLPLDEEAIVASVRKTTRCVTAHEAVVRGGFGAELAAVIQHAAFDYSTPRSSAWGRSSPLPFAPAMEQWVVPRRRRPGGDRRTVAGLTSLASEVKLPRLGQGMEAGTIVRWLKSEGEAVAKGEPLYELDTDKVTQEVEADADGVLLKIVVSDGEVDVGTTVGVIGAEGEDVSGLVAPRGNGGRPRLRPNRRLRRPRRKRKRRPPTAAACRPSGGRARSEPARAAHRARARDRPGDHLRHRARGSRHRGGRREGRIGGARAGCRSRPRPARTARGRGRGVELTSVRRTIAPA